MMSVFFFFQAEDGIRDRTVTGVQTCALPICACVFLGADNRCRIHAKFGSAAKPLACRIYPFMLIPAGEQWRLGLRFACRSEERRVGKECRIRRWACQLEQSKDYECCMALL